MKTYYKLFLILLLFLPCAAAYSQEDSVSKGGLDDMSLKDLLNMKIVSASGTAELWMDAPLSSSIVT